MFKAVLIERDDRPYRATLTSLEEGRLPTGDVTVRVDYSTLNYKDALAITGKAPVVRQFPMVPGVDFAGAVDTVQCAIKVEEIAQGNSSRPSAARCGLALGCQGRACLAPITRK